MHALIVKTSAIGDVVQTFPVVEYLKTVQGVDRIDVQFRPFWIKRMPDLKEHISFQLAK